MRPQSRSNCYLLIPCQFGKPVAQVVDRVGEFDKASWLAVGKREEKDLEMSYGSYYS